MSTDTSPRRRARLRRHNWLDKGLAALGEAGHGALQAEPLARRLGTTKGSFYWHFADLPAFHAAILDRWEQDASAALDAALADEAGEVARLRRFGQVIADKPGGTDVEPAIRAWALGMPKAAEAVARVDATRLSYLSGLLDDLGIGNPEMAQILYAASIGMEAMGPAAPANRSSAMGTLVDLVLALR